MTRLHGKGEGAAGGNWSPKAFGDGENVQKGLGPVYFGLGPVYFRAHPPIFDEEGTHLIPSGVFVRLHTQQMLRESVPVNSDQSNRKENARRREFLEVDP